MIRFLRHSFGLVSRLGANGFFKVLSLFGKGTTFAARGGRFVVWCSLYADYVSIFKQ